MEREAGFQRKGVLGMVKLKQSKYVISRRKEDTYWFHMSQQRAIGRNLLKCGQIEH